MLRMINLAVKLPMSRLHNKILRTPKRKQTSTAGSESKSKGLQTGVRTTGFDGDVLPSVRALRL